MYSKRSKFQFCDNCWRSLVHGFDDYSFHEMGECVKFTEKGKFAFIKNHLADLKMISFLENVGGKKRKISDVLGVDFQMEDSRKASKLDVEMENKKTLQLKITVTKFDLHQAKMENVLHKLGLDVCEKHEEKFKILEKLPLEFEWNEKDNQYDKFHHGWVGILENLQCFAKSL